MGTRKQQERQEESWIETPTREEQRNAQGLEEVVADKGYHSGARVEDWGAIGVRSYIPEPQRGRRHWQNQRGEQAAVYGNRRRRGEFLERTFAHVYDTGGMRRTHLRGHRNILKRLLLHVAAFNLSLILRREAGVGTPRSLPDRRNRVFFCFWAVWMLLAGLRKRYARQQATSAGRFWFLLLPDQTRSTA